MFTFNINFVVPLFRTTWQQSSIETKTKNSRQEAEMGLTYCEVKKGSSESMVSCDTNGCSFWLVVLLHAFMNILEMAYVTHKGNNNNLCMYVCIYK